MWMKKGTNVSSTRTDVNIHTLKRKTSTFNFICIHNLPLFDFKGAAIAKKKMMKKFGWYKTSEEGGGMSAVPVVMFILRDSL